jgi:hypothetical protein
MRDQRIFAQELIGPTLPADPRDWPDAVKLAHAMRMAERTIDRHPGIAEMWLRSCDTIRSRMC